MPAVTPHDLDRILHVLQSRFTAGRSPSTEPIAFLDWAAHAADAPFQYSLASISTRSPSPLVQNRTAVLAVKSTLSVQAWNSRSFGLFLMRLGW